MGGADLEGRMGLDSPRAAQHWLLRRAFAGAPPRFAAGRGGKTSSPCIIAQNSQKEDLVLE
jgi:hypothetical protein